MDYENESLFGVYEQIFWEDYLEHYGTKRHSGRYPWGSGKNPFQHSGDFISRVSSLKKEGLTESKIAEAINQQLSEFYGENTHFTTGDLRAYLSIAKAEQDIMMRDTAHKLHEKGYSNSEIGRRMGVGESRVRLLLKQDSTPKRGKVFETANYLRDAADRKGMVDVGAGTEFYIGSGVSEDMRKRALKVLEAEGYEVYNINVAQPTNPGQFTNTTVLAKPGTEYKEAYNFGEVHSIFEDEKILAEDGTIQPAFRYPASMDSKRLQIRYAEEGGLERDGLVEIRRGVPDLSLGKANYAQVRILVDGTHYIKGMAVYSDDLPEGVDVRFNTNKHRGKPMKEVLKPISSDPDNPFNSLIKERGGQYTYVGEDGEEHLSLINKRADEGDWGDWADSLPSQFLAKQPVKLIERQLGLAQADKKAEFDEICSLTNPTVKKVLLEKFAEDCETAASTLKAATLPRQKYQVILPSPEVKDTEVYAPNFRDGEEVVLVRFPYAGPYESPRLTVNNKNKAAIKMIGKNPADAVVINARTAEKLSGADFDGDTVMVIPTQGAAKSVLSQEQVAAMPGLKGFDPKEAYPEREGMRYMKVEVTDPMTGKKVVKSDATQMEMGKISNLIMDMYLQGASPEEMERATKHSMVVIDAGKHKLDYKRSEIELGISELRRRYQPKVSDDGTERYGGASTLITQAKGDAHVPKATGQAKVNLQGKSWYDPSRPEGALIYDRSRAETYVDKKGKTQVRTETVTKMSQHDDARDLISQANTVQERLYAEHANSMKRLAEKARVAAAEAGRLEYSAEARKTYALEAEQLESALRLSKMNAPRERQAQLLANSRIKAKQQEEVIEKSELKKVRQREMVAARKAVGAKRVEIDITPRQWEAIQAGAISDTKLAQILTRADIDKVREYATPKARTQLTQGKINRLNAMLASGNYTTVEIAAALSVSTSTVNRYADKR